MSLLNQINHLHRVIGLHKILSAEIPEYHNWDENKLYEYITQNLDRLHSENWISSFVDAEKVYFELSETKSDYERII